jgi:hypothetical protein
VRRSGISSFDSLSRAARLSAPEALQFPASVPSPVDSPKQDHCAPQGMGPGPFLFFRSPFHEGVRRPAVLASAVSFFSACLLILRLLLDFSSACCARLLRFMAACALLPVEARALPSTACVLDCPMASPLSGQISSSCS